jgi:hypothetical protein
MVSARQLVGRRIVGFQANAYRNGEFGIIHHPVIFLDDGTKLFFITEEDGRNGADYGTTIIKAPA